MSTSAAPSDISGEGEPRARHLWIVVLAACAGQFLVVLDVSVINVALPSMRTALGLSEVGLQWVVNLYTLTFAGFLLLGGRVADLFGQKRVFIAGLGLFTAASLAGGLAQEPWQLLAARAVQGVGAAVLAPATLTILTTAFPRGPARTRAIGTWTAVGAAGGATGGLVGGVLTDLLSWRWVLLINVPVGALLLTAAVLWLAESRDGGERTGGRGRLDVPGALLVTVGLGAVAFGIVRTESLGWTAVGALLPLAAGFAILALFVAVEARTEAPLMPLGLFRLRSVSAANLSMLICGGAMLSMWYFLSLYMQNVLHYSPIETGLGFLPHSTTIILGSKLAPRLMHRFDAKYVAAAGATLACGGYLWQTGMHVGGGYLGTVMGPGVLMALGVGLAATPLAATATADAAPRDAGLVSGLVNTSRTMGGALGLAVLSTAAATRGGSDAGPQALASGYALAFRTGALMLAACAVLMLFALPRSDGSGEDTDGPDGGADGAGAGEAGGRQSRKGSPDGREHRPEHGPEHRSENRPEHSDFSDGRSDRGSDGAADPSASAGGQGSAPRLGSGT